MVFKSHVVIEVDSNNFSSGKIGSFEILLKNAIKLSQHRQYFMRLENIRIPTSYYNITTRNNTFIVEEDNGATQVNVTATITPGNYLITELLTELETQLDANTVQTNDYTIVRSDITGKITLSFTGGSTAITVLSTGKLNKVVGFSESVNSSSGTSITSPNHVNLSAVRFLKIGTNITSNNSYSKDFQQSIGVKVPITVGRSTVEFYDNHNGHMSKMENTHSLNSIRFRVTDQDNKQIDFNGVDWSCDLIVYEFRE